MDNEPFSVNSSGGFVRLVDHMGDDSSPAQAARVSYGAGTKTITEDKDLTRFLMRHEHFSPFAMAQVKLHMRFPIFIHNQMVRHDRFHWNLMSGRYSVMPEDKWIPKREEIRGQGKGNKQVGDGSLLKLTQGCGHEAILNANTASQKAYDQLLDLGVCREQARTVLPLGQYSEGYATANLGDWLLFLKQRLAPGAQKEIREYAEVIRDILFTLFPTVVQAWEDYQLNAVTFSAQEMAALRQLIKGMLCDVYTGEEEPKGDNWEQVAVDNGGMYGTHTWARPFGIFEMTQAQRVEFFESFGLTNKRERIEFWNKLKG